jgi:hypothetical protein
MIRLVSELPVDDQIAVARGVIILGLFLVLIVIVFRLGASLGHLMAVDEMQWHLDKARIARERERAETQ